MTEEVQIPVSSGSGTTSTKGNGHQIRKVDSLDFFDADAYIHDHEPFDYFDAMEVMYFEDMMHEKMTPLGPKGPGLKVRVQESQAKLRKLAAERQAKLEKSIHKRHKKLRDKMNKPGFIMTIDKVSFVMGILIIMLTEFVLLMQPHKMGLLYSVLLFPLMIIRYVLYQKEKFHYFMYDFCYFAQVMLIINMYKMPENELLMKANFALTNGPLAMATVMWRNSLVFHSMDKMTSAFIHMLPPLVMFSMRWEQQLFERKFPAWEPVSLSTGIASEFIVKPFLLYLAWQGLYLIKTEVISKRKLRYNTEIMTSLRYLTRKPGSSSYKIINKYGEKHQLTVFVMYQAIYTLMTLLPIPLLWYSIRLHALYLAFIFLVALKNGAAYYFHVFAVRYIDQIGKNGSSNTMQSASSPEEEADLSGSESSLMSEHSSAKAEVKE